jgi:hypothetical protein
MPGLRGPGWPPGSFRRKPAASRPRRWSLSSWRVVPAGNDSVHRSKAPGFKAPAWAGVSDAERRTEHRDTTRALPRASIERLLSRRDIPLREKTLWRMLYDSLLAPGDRVLPTPGLGRRLATGELVR